MKTAIVILNWNGVKLLEQFLPSVVAHSSEYADIYVADNASTDTSIEFIKKNFTSVKIIQNTINGGYSKGYNDALKKISAEIYCLLNSDIEVTKDWLIPVITEFKTNTETAIIQPKILDYKNKSKFEYAGAAGGYIDFFGYPYCRGRLFNNIEEDANQFNDTKEIFWASGACFFIRSKVYHELNGLDEDFFAHQEEIDLCWRAKNRNYSIKYLSKSVVFHVGGATLKENNPRKTYLNFRNSLLSGLKNLPSNTIFIVIFMRLILDGLAGIKFIVELKPKHTLAILKAHLSFYANFVTFYKKRSKYGKLKKYYLHTSIVWQYFVLGRKKFEKLK